MTNNIFICAALAAAFASSGANAAEGTNAGGHAHWSYFGQAGARHWGDMQPDYAACKFGKQQSPIDIRRAARSDLPPIDFNYTNSPAEVVNNGHTIQVNLAAGGTIKLGSGEYKLVQFHFHAPSEERINGKTYSLVAHFVHKDADGKLAVVAVLFRRGKENPALARIFAAMPKHPEGKAALPDGFNPADLLPAKRAYYAYMGSLTTPPCSEGVRWQVLKQPVEWSEAQRAAFRKLYPMNARPVQPLNGRIVEQGM